MINANARRNVEHLGHLRYHARFHCDAVMDRLIDTVADRLGEHPDTFMVTITCDWSLEMPAIGRYRDFLGVNDDALADVVGCAEEVVLYRMEGVRSTIFVFYRIGRVAEYAGREWFHIPLKPAQECLLRCQDWAASFDQSRLRAINKYLDGVLADTGAWEPLRKSRRKVSKARTAS